MIACATCKFEVSNKMRHALTKNMCPACGSALLGDFHMQRLSSIREKLLAQEFCRQIDQSLIFDISMFIMSEFFPSKPQRTPISEVEDTQEDEDISSIREQVRREILSKASIDEELDDHSEVEEDEPEEDEADDDIDMEIRSSGSKPVSDQDLKVAKLKRIYNESPTLRKTGVSVRRIT